MAGDLERCRIESGQPTCAGGKRPPTAIARGAAGSAGSPATAGGVCGEAISNPVSQRRGRVSGRESQADLERGRTAVCADAHDHWNELGEDGPDKLWGGVVQFLGSDFDPKLSQVLGDGLSCEPREAVGSLVHFLGH